MTPEQIEQIRPRLVEFTAQVLDGAVARSDQRVEGESCVRGLLTDGAHKSMQPMAERLGVDHQQLQHGACIASSPQECPYAYLLDPDELQPWRP